MDDPAQQTARLFDEGRPDVVMARDEAGVAIGLVNTTHGLVWIYQRGFAQVDSEGKTLWGFRPEIPEHVLLAVVEDAADHPGIGVLRQAETTTTTKTCTTKTTTIVVAGITFTITTQTCTETTTTNGGSGPPPQGLSMETR